MKPFTRMEPVIRKPWIVYKYLNIVTVAVMLIYGRVSGRAGWFWALAHRVLTAKL